MIPIAEKGGYVTIMGLPFHGIAYDGIFTKPDNTVLPVPKAGAVNHLVDMGYEMPDRTGNQLDLVRGYEWRSKLLLSGSTKLPANQFVYVDGNNIPWILECTYTKTPAKLEYRLKCSVKRRFGLFEQTPSPDLDFEFFDSGLIDLTGPCAELGVSSFTGLTYNQNHRGSSVAVMLGGSFTAGGSIPRLSWVTRKAVTVSILSVSGAVNPSTGSGLAGNYTQQLDPTACCGGYTNEQNSATYTSFGHGRHDTRISTPNSNQNMCDYYSVPYTGGNYNAIHDWDDYQVEKAPGGLRASFQTNNTYNRDIQIVVFSAYYESEELKIVRAVYKDYTSKPVDSNRVLASLSYVYDYAYRSTGDYTLTRDNSCEHFDWSFVSSYTEAQNLDYQFDDLRGYGIDLTVNGAVIDWMTLERKRSYVTNMNNSSSGPLQNNGGTDDLISGGVTMQNSSDVDDPDYPAGLNTGDVPSPTTSDTLVLTISGVTYSNPGSPFFNAFKYVDTRSNTVGVGNVLAGYDIENLLGWSELPGLPSRYYSLVGPDAGTTVKGIVGDYAVYDMFKRQTFHDQIKELCAI